jgi:hypothetical protein
MIYHQMDKTYVDKPINGLLKTIKTGKLLENIG